MESDGFGAFGPPAARRPTEFKECSRSQGVLKLGDRIRGTPGDIDPLNKVFKRARRGLRRAPL